MIYTYIATLKDGRKITGEYESNGLSSQKIEVPEATQDNPMVSLLVQKKAKTIAELSKFKSICKNCNSKLIQTSKYGSWVDYLECPVCKTKVLVHHQDAMSGCLIDYVIVIEKNGTSEFIEVPFKD